MVRVRLALACLATGLLCVPAVVPQPPSIAVDLGAYDTAQKAAHDEAAVNWIDADKSDDTVCTLSFAAVELQSYLRRATGLDEAFSIVDDDDPPAGDLILIGGPTCNAAAKRLGPALGVSTRQLEDLGPEGYRIKTLGHGGRRILLIAGGGRVGTLYGVYDLLHRLGVRWYAPGDWNEEVPAVNPRAIADLDVTQTPAFETRGFHAWENRGDDEFLQWMARNRMNYWCVEQDNKPLMHKLGIMMVGGGHVLTSYYLGPRLAYPYNHPRLKTDDQKPRDPYPISPQYMGDANEDGKLSYFEAHPEWYALRDGKRSDRIHGDGGDNFCTSNADAMAEWMKNAVEDLATGRYKDAQIMNAWMLDGGKWCQCEKCKALGSQTDRNILFVHHYAQAIKRAQAQGRINRPVRLLFLAYADVLAPPTHPLPSEFDYDTCIATYFPIVRCYVHEFADPACSRNARYAKHLYGWSADPDRHYRGQVCIGEYYNVSGYKCLPVVYMDTMTQDIPYYYGRGARHFHYMHCTTQNWGNKALTNWQMARQLWDPDVDCGKLWNDYFTGRYGRAYPQMRRFYENLQWMLCNVSDLKYGLARRLERGPGNLYTSDHLRYDSTKLGRATQAPSPLLPPNLAYEAGNRGPSLLDDLSHATQCRRIITGVLNEQLPDRVRLRVREDERLFTYGERTLRYYDAVSRSCFALREGDRKTAKQHYAQAQELADLLKQDTTSTKFASSHANARDAFAATYATGAMGMLTAALGPASPEEAKVFDPDEGLALQGNEFQGGGALRFGYGFRGYPSGITLSKLGNYVYGQGTSPHDSIKGWFRLPEAPGSALYLSVMGALTPVKSKGAIAGQVYVNDSIVFSGNVPFVEGKVTRLELKLPPRILKQGLNTVVIRNTEPQGVIGNRPWFGIDRIELNSKAVKARPFDVGLRGPLDLALKYTSRVDGTEQPYRVYLPSAYDHTARLPVLIALHGTGGDQNKYFDHPSYGNGIYKTQADERGVIVVCPHGRGTTEYHGIGENDVMTVIDEVIRQFAVDEDRIICSGQSMGGTGTTYLCCRYPDVFAAGIPLASCYGHTNLLENLRHVPMFYVQGAKDWPIYAREGPIPITRRLKELGYEADLWMIPGQPHNTMKVSTGRVLDWALKHRRTRHPRRVTFNAYLPIHGRAYWLEVQQLEKIGYLARVDAQIRDGNTIRVQSTNTRQLALRPDPQLLDLGRPIGVSINGEKVFSQPCNAGQQVSCVLGEDGWRATVAPSALRPTTAYRTHRIGAVASVPTQTGPAETSLGNWMADMMREVCGTDVAIYNRRHYRGVALRKGQDLYLIDLLNWLRPCVRRMCRLQCTGGELKDIIEANILNDAKKAEFLVQVSGCKYAFDRSRPRGDRIVETDIVPQRTYTVACEGQVLSRETMYLAGRFGKIAFEELEPTVVSGAWRYIADHGGVVRASLEGRVRDVTSN